MSACLFSFCLSLKHGLRLCFDCTRSDGDFCLGEWRMPEMWWSCPLGGCCETGEHCSPAARRLILLGAFLQTVIIPVLHKSNLMLCFTDRCAWPICAYVLSLVLLDTNSDLPLELFSAASYSEVILLSCYLPLFISFLYVWIMGKLYVTQEIQNPLPCKMTAPLHIQIRPRMSLSASSAMSTGLCIQISPSAVFKCIQVHKTTFPCFHYNLQILHIFAEHF